MHEMSLGISMPVLNEQHGIGQLLTEIAAALHGVRYTICIVDDGSTDGTLEVVEEFIRRGDRIKLIRRVRDRYGCQRGAASRAALEWLVANTTDTVFVEMDADGAQRPEELVRGARQVAILGYDVAIASKYVYGSRVIGRTFARRLISWVYSWVARQLFDRRIRDYSNCYRFYTRRAAECLLRFKPRYASPVYLLEILVTLMANKFTIIELPTVYVERESGRSKVTFVDLIKGFLGTLDIALRFYRHQYREEDLHAGVGVGEPAANVKLLAKR